MTPSHRRSVLAACLTLTMLAGCGGSAATPAGSASSAPAVATPSQAPAATTALPPTPAPSSAPVTTPSPAPTPVSAQDQLDAFRTSWAAPGAVALLRVGGGSWSAASGAADTAGTPITDTTRFRIASITKPIVATLVLQSVARGELKLDAVVGDILPGVLRPTPRVTVRQLLDHTSGIYDESNTTGDPTTDIEKLADPALRKQAQDLLRRYLAGERVIAADRLLVALSETHDRYFAPGTDYHYSNTNYQLAVMVLRKVTGSSLAELLRTRITEPLGLTHTNVAPPDTGSPEMRGYVRGTDGKLADVTDDLLTFGNGGNGGIVSTPSDLLTIMQAIVSGKLLPAAQVAEMKTPNLQSYGLGLGTYALPCGTFYGHGGAVNGTLSIALVSDSGDRGVVVATNMRGDGEPDMVLIGSSIVCSR